MNFFIGALIVDCLTNSNDSSDGVGAGLLTSIFACIYTIFNLKKFEQYILNICAGKVDILIYLLISFTILIPIYWSVKKYKKCIFIVNILLRIMIYIDIFAGIAIMIIGSNLIGMPIPSYIFNISKITLAAGSDSFLVSLSGSCMYLFVKFLDITLTLILIPIIQYIIIRIFEKVKYSISNYKKISEI